MNAIVSHIFAFLCGCSFVILGAIYFGKKGD